MSDAPDPLLARVNALLQRHQRAPRAPDEDVPVLTEVVEDRSFDPAPARRSVEPAALEALVSGIKEAVLEQLEPRIERLVAERMTPVLSHALEDALAQASSTLTAEIRNIVDDAVASALARALEPDPPAPD